MHDPQEPAQANLPPAARRPPASSAPPSYRSARAPARGGESLARGGASPLPPDALPHRAPANDNGVDEHKVALLRAAIARGQLRWSPMLIAERLLST